MAYRFHENERWTKDEWFMKLSPHSKLIFIYLIDNCNLAGFFEYSPYTMSLHTKLSEEEVVKAVEELSKSIIIRDGVIWVKNFIKRQNNYPINPKNGAHKNIIKGLTERQDLFPEAFRLLDWKGASPPNDAPTKGGLPFTSIGKDKGKSISNNNKSESTSAKFDPDNFPENEAEISSYVTTAFIRTMGSTPKIPEREMYMELAKEYGLSELNYAMKEAALNNAKSLKYVEAILRNKRVQENTKAAPAENETLAYLRRMREQNERD